MHKTFQELLDMQKAYRKKLREEGETAMKEAFKEVFETHPSIDSIYWTQYTPYFNDGDPCYFRLNEYEVEFLEDDEDEAIKNDDHDKVYDDINAIFEAGDDIFESVFGDHKRIEVTSEGISVSKYSHD